MTLITNKKKKNNTHSSRNIVYYCLIIKIIRIDLITLSVNIFKIIYKI